MTLALSATTVRPDLPATALRARAPRAVDATLVARQDLSPSMARFRIRPDDGPRPFVAGQYATLSLSDPAVPPRPYSIASGPGAAELDFIISLVADGALTPHLFGLRIGDRLRVGEARGLFRLDEADALDHLLIGTGSGIAPLLSMLATLTSRSVPPRTVVLHGARVRGELADRDILESRDPTWLSYRPTLSRLAAADAWPGRRGRVGVHLDSLIAAGELTPQSTIAYLCGSPAMIEACSSRLTAFGVPRDAIRSECFVAP